MAMVNDRDDGMKRRKLCSPEPYRREPSYREQGHPLQRLALGLATRGARLSLCLAFGLVFGLGLPAQAAIQSSATRSVAVQPLAAPESAAQLMKDVIYNELQDRERDSFWQYRSHVVTPKKDILREQIETAQGPVYLVLASHGQPLSATELSQEQQRLLHALHHPSDLARTERLHIADEARLAHMMALIPVAYCFSYDGPATGAQVRIHFWPNPSYQPKGYEDRILHGLRGMIVVDQTQKRLLSIEGKIENKINFGFGLLGYVDQGGTFSIARTELTPAHWKTSKIDVDVTGRILLFSEVSKVQEETRWDFQPVPQNITLEQAYERLEQSEASYRSKQAAP